MVSQTADICTGDWSENKSERVGVRVEGGGSGGVREQEVEGGREGRGRGGGRENTNTNMKV